MQQESWYALDCKSLTLKHLQARCVTGSGELANPRDKRGYRLSEIAAVSAGPPWLPPPPARRVLTTPGELQTVTASYRRPPIIRSRTFLVIRWTRGSSRAKSRLGGLTNPGGVDRTMFHQHVPALKTTFPFGPS